MIGFSRPHYVGCAAVILAVLLITVTTIVRHGPRPTQVPVLSWIWVEPEVDCKDCTTGGDETVGPSSASDNHTQMYKMAKKQARKNCDSFVTYLQSIDDLARDTQGIWPEEVKGIDFFLDNRALTADPILKHRVGSEPIVASEDKAPHAQFSPLHDSPTPCNTT